MTAHEINIVLQVSCTTLLLFGCILLIKHAREGLNSWTGIGFVLSIVCYLILETLIVQENRLLFIITVTGSISVPVVFFLLTKSIFDDHFKPSWNIAGWFILEIAAHFWVYIGRLVDISFLPPQFCYLIAEVVSIGFVLAGFYTTVRTRKSDLIESRRRFRYIFVSVTAALIVITLIVEAMPIAKESVDVLQILQRSSILVLTSYFLISNFEIRPGFFFKELPKEKPVVIEDSQLRRSLESLIGEKKVYRKEGLTIGELADMLDEQEYKVRRLINGELGFRNFNDFLNKYRVNEACEILSDPSQNRKTILEIAYSLGYQSIGPFNKAFKELKETTPTAFRKSTKPEIPV